MVIIQRWVYILNLEKVIQTSALIFSVDLAAIVQSERHYSNGGGGGGGGERLLQGTTTVNSEIFARILFSRIALKDKFTSLKNRK